MIPGMVYAGNFHENKIFISFSELYAGRKRLLNKRINEYLIY